MQINVQIIENLVVKYPEVKPIIESVFDAKPKTRLTASLMLRRFLDDNAEVSYQHKLTILLLADLGEKSYSLSKDTWTNNLRLWCDGGTSRWIKSIFDKNYDLD